MNTQHFRALLWLRWRLLVNRLKKGGAANAVLLGLLAALVAGLAVLGFAGSLLVGLFAMPGAPPWVHLLVWDGLVGLFLVFWLSGLAADLQRSEPLSLGRLLHLPVSPTGAFLVNYLSSLVSITLSLFLAPVLGLTLGLALAQGPAVLVVLPLLAAFVLAVTGVTYQFQGWLASLMTNPRRRRAVIVLATTAGILFSQVPNLLNIYRPWNDSLVLEKLEGWARVANLVLPAGWLPLGATAAAAEGSLLPALLGTLGLALIGAGSLWRAYRTTLRLYTGQLTSAPKRAEPTQAAPAPKPTGRLLDRRLPWLSERVSAIALGGFTSLLRAPEAKMQLLTPLILMVAFGSLLLSRGSGGNPPEAARALLALGGMTTVLFGMAQLAGNQFGFDRAGFRVFVLSPAPRSEVLLGKNLALAPLPLAWAAVVLAALECFYPLRPDHLLAAVPQMLSMYLLFCALANWLSILAPHPVAAGSFKSSGPARLATVLLGVAFACVMPVVLAVTLVPLGVELLAAELGGLGGVPIHLPLSLALAAGVVWLYRRVLRWQGRALQAREQQILKVVTATKE